MPAEQRDPIKVRPRFYLLDHQTEGMTNFFVSVGSRNDGSSHRRFDCSRRAAQMRFPLLDGWVIRD